MISLQPPLDRKETALPPTARPTCRSNFPLTGRLDRADPDEALARYCALVCDTAERLFGTWKETSLPYHQQREVREEVDRLWDPTTRTRGDLDMTAKPELVTDALNQILDPRTSQAEAETIAKETAMTVTADKPKTAKTRTRKPKTAYKTGPDTSLAEIAAAQAEEARAKMFATRAARKAKKDGTATAEDVAAAKAAQDEAEAKARAADAALIASQMPGAKDAPAKAKAAPKPKPAPKPKKATVYETSKTTRGLAMRLDVFHSRILAEAEACDAGKISDLPDFDRFDLDAALTHLAEFVAKLQGRDEK